MTSFYKDIAKFAVKDLKIMSVFADNFYFSGYEYETKKELLYFLFKEDYKGTVDYCQDEFYRHKGIDNRTPSWVANRYNYYKDLGNFSCSYLSEKAINKFKQFSIDVNNSNIDRFIDSIQSYFI